jgi:two-component system CheB/CheR fusion protein
MVVSADEKIFIHYAEGNAPTHEQFAYSMSNIDAPIEPININGMDDDDSISYKAHELDTSVLE